MASEESQTFTTRLKAFAQKYKFDRHRTIERFGVTTTALAVTGSLIIGGGLVSARMVSLSDLTQIAQYTTEFTASRTQVEGDVVGVYRSRDARRALVLMKFNDPTEMSSDATTYQSYVSGIKGDVPTGSAAPVDSVMAGQIISFGTTGYLGVLLESTEEFEPQLLNLTMRATEEIVDSKIDSTEVIAGDPSFSKYDQWRVIVNPGADEAIVSEALSVPGSPDVRALYAETAMAEQEKELRRDLNAGLSEMHAALERIASFERQMQTTTAFRNGEEVRLVPPVLPDFIRGDSVEGMSASQVRVELENAPADTIPGLASQTPQARALDFADEDYVPNTYVLNSMATVPGGYSYQWRSKTVVDGYLKDVVPAGEDPVTYIADNLGNTAGASILRDMEWPLSDGGTLGSSTREQQGLMPLTNLRNNLAQAYSGYYKAKLDYQGVKLRDLLLLELELDRTVRDTTLASGNEHVSFNR